MKDHYDILVVGGGPGGAVAARTAARKGMSVCLVEKRPAIGAPIRCAEGVGTEAVREFIDPDPCWISAEICQATLVAPNGTRMDLSPQMSGNKVGYVLDRKIFDRELVWQAADAGSDVVVKARATAPVIEDGIVKGAVINSCGVTRKVSADVVIAADGVESKFSRWCGIDTTVPLREIMSSVQYLMTNLPIDSHTTLFYLGNKVAPQGYLWVFPKGERSANVGVGIPGTKSGTGHRAKDYLDRFVAATFPEGRAIECIAGGVSVCRPLEKTSAPGLLIIGDAARMVDPLTGGGIYCAMYSGRLAAEVAGDAVSSGNCGAETLSRYDREWRSSKTGQSLERNYRLKEIFITMSDEKLNALIESASSLDLTEITTFTLVKELMKRNPALVLDLAKAKDLLG